MPEIIIPTLITMVVVVIVFSIIGYIVFLLFSGLVSDKLYLSKKYFAFGFWFLLITLLFVLSYFILVEWVKNQSDVDLTNSTDAISQMLFQNEHQAKSFKSFISMLSGLEEKQQKLVIGMYLFLIWVLSLFPLAYSIARLKEQMRVNSLIDSIYYRTTDLSSISQQNRDTHSKLESISQHINSIEYISSVSRELERRLYLLDSTADRLDTLERKLDVVTTAINNR